MSRVGLAISAYRSDASVERLLRLAAPMVPSVFERVLVVDSLGSGALSALIEQEGWSAVEYVNSPINLGSAGNLAARLQWSADQGLDFVYAINHDGALDAQVVAKLVAFAETRPTRSLGAVYPLRVQTRHGDAVDLSGRSRIPLPFMGRDAKPEEKAVQVLWSSSNGTLYPLLPIRQGLEVWADLWMGWEDLAYGWLLDANGFEQWVVTDAVFRDQYEYRQHAVGPLRFRLADKPAWYSYYATRNMLLALRRTGQSPLVVAASVARLSADVAVTLAFRDRKVERLRLAVSGARDALLGRTGKGPVP